MRMFCELCTRALQDSISPQGFETAFGRLAVNLRRVLYTLRLIGEQPHHRHHHARTSRSPCNTSSYLRIKLQCRARGKSQ